jgi:AcrR family transcriptional regulator
VDRHPQPRPHTGRQRNDAARQAILDAAFVLFRETPGPDVTIDAIAAAAGVGKQTIYRWWPTKGAVIAAAITERARASAATPDLGSLRSDLHRFVSDTFAVVTDPRNTRMLRQLMAAAQNDAHLATTAGELTAHRRHEMRSILERGRGRGELAATADVDTLVDLAYGFLWYRLLLDHAPLDAEAAENLVVAILAAGTMPVP